jgi:hypothetical protein
MSTALEPLTKQVLKLGQAQRIAMILWCMDRASAVLDAVTLNDAGQEIRDILDQSRELWNGPGAWSSQFLQRLKDQCESYDAESLEIEAKDSKPLDRLFPGPTDVTGDHLINAVTQAVSLVWSAATIIPRAEKEEVANALEAFYDTFYQPTFDYLTRDRTEIDPGQIAEVHRVVDSTNPLKSALEAMEAHIQLLESMKEISFSDAKLRGTLS